MLEADFRSLCSYLGNMDDLGDLLHYRYLVRHWNHMRYFNHVGYMNDLVHRVGLRNWHWMRYRNDFVHDLHNFGLVVMPSERDGTQNK